MIARFQVMSILLISSLWSWAQDVIIEVPETVLTQIQTSIAVSTNSLELETLTLLVNGQPVQVTLEKGKGVFTWVFNEKTRLIIETGSQTIAKEIHPIPLWLSILPPLIAILMALIFREVISSLFLGIFVGALIISAYSSGLLMGVVQAFRSVIDLYILQSLEDSGHLSIILFSTLIGGMVAVISKNGGMLGVVNLLSRFAQSARSCQLVTWLLGVLIFFDDYANTLIVGSTMRPVTDRFRVSREKLSYIVDSTAAPVASVAFVTTWIGAELGYIGSGIADIPEISSQHGVYAIFMNSLRFSFYPLFTLAFMLMLIGKKRDFGPMLKAESRARIAGTATSNQENTQALKDKDLAELKPMSGIQAHSLNAIIPVVLVIAGTIAGLIITGWDQTVWHQADLSLYRKMSHIIGHSDSYQALLWSSLLGITVAVALSVGQKIMSLSAALEACMSGFKTMLTAIVILVLAWSLALVTEHLHTADYLTGVLSGNIAPALIPAITFVLAALVSFSTGSSWGTMAILYPLMLPAAWTLSQQQGLTFDSTMLIFYNTVSCVLAGSVLGDHCSPISDTTILSSLASSCNHIEHVRTQLPYALVVGSIALFVGTIPAGFGLSSWIIFPIGLVLLFLIVHFVGKTVPEDEKTSFFKEKA
ncbi:MAG: sodium:proton antiporter [Acidobacteria bacterium]|nr:MAG: sodium:proton antiporter [Acidobacteriota bacterium]